MPKRTYVTVPCASAKFEKSKSELGILIPREKMLKLVMGSVVSIVPLHGARDCCFAGGSRCCADS